jgi:hypothetical protein
MMLPLHLQRSRLAAIVDCLLRGQLAGLDRRNQLNHSRFDFFRSLELQQRSVVSIHGITTKEDRYAVHQILMKRQPHGNLKD